MTQNKRLTRRQKILLSKIKQGRQPSGTDDPADLQVLDDRRLIEIHMWNHVWQATEEAAGARKPFYFSVSALWYSWRLPCVLNLRGFAERMTSCAASLKHAETRTTLLHAG